MVEELVDNVKVVPLGGPVQRGPAIDIVLRVDIHPPERGNV